jgi:prepilin-type N-terminal cleavage/methylation domain-containing protein
MRPLPSPESGAVPAGTLDERGVSLIEVLVAMAILGSVGTAILTGLQVATSVAVSNRVSALAELAARNFANALDDATYIDCGAPPAYSPAALAFAAPPGVVVTVLAVGHWNGSSSVPEANSDTAFPSECVTDKGLQRITFRVVATVSGKSATRTQSVLKRFEGSYPEPTTVDPLPGGWNECTVRSSDGQDTWVNEDEPDVNSGTADEMNIFYRTNLRRFSYLWFDVRPGILCQDGATTLPDDANIRSVRLSLYTFNVGGAPACDGSCWHVFERVPAAWDESTLTWNNQPCPTGYAESCETNAASATVNGRTLFPHGGRQRDALFQVVTSPSASNGTALLDDVRSFFADPARNFGWVIKEACVQRYGKSCGTIRPGFQMRTSSAAVPQQRPTLTLVYR